jgi:predicted RNase H-like HicB family nuclease
MNHYVALIDRAADGSYGMVFPDFPGCTSAGDTFADVVQNGTEALSAHVCLMRQDGDAISPPRALEEIKAAEEDWIDWADAVVTLIPLLPPAGRSIRINVTLDERLLAEIDAVSRNRSGFLADAARRVLAG